MKNIILTLFFLTIPQGKLFPQVNKKLVTKKFTIGVEDRRYKFEIHGQAKDISYMLRTIEIIKDIGPPIIEYFDYRPTTSIHITLNFRSHFANGIAQVFPRNHMTLNTFPPVGNSYLNTGEDWLKILVIHELTHIVHLDQTSGFPQAIRSVFGSAAKWGTVVPRWFAEGVAVWAESRFSKGGRVKNKFIKMQVDRVLSDIKACHDISCIDNPGAYPYQRYAYQIGGLFLNYLEDKKYGTINCLVKQNSKNIPFFLDSAFTNCIGKNSNQAFLEFIKHNKEQLLNKKRELQKNYNIQNKDISLITVENAVNLEKDFQIIGDNLIYAQNIERRNYIKSLDLITKKITKIDFNNHIHSIISSNSKDKVNLTGYGYFNPYKGRDFYQLDIKNNKLKKLNGNGDYIFTLDNNKVVYLKYKDHQWKFFKDKKNFLTLPKGIQLSNPKLTSRDNTYFITAKIFNHYKNPPKPFQLWSISLDGQIEVLFKSEDPFYYLGQCSKTHILNINDKTMHLLSVDKIDQVKQNTLALPNLSEFVAIRGNNKHTVLIIKSFPDKILYSESSCNNLIKELKEEFHSQTISHLPRLKDIKNYKTPNNTSFDDYNALENLAPHYFLFNTNFEDNNRFFKIFTSVNDPKKRHDIGLNATRYIDFKKNGIEIDYTYANNPFLFMGTYFDLSYKRINQRVAIDRHREIFLGIRNFFSKYKNFNSIHYSLEEIKSTLSNINAKVVKLKHHGFYMGRMSNSLLQFLSLSTSINYNEPKTYSNYWGLETSINSKLKINNNFKIDFSSEYGRLFKDDIISGLLYGGGSPEISTGFEFKDNSYSFFNADAYGNKILTFDISGSYKIANVYKGYRLLPAFLKTTSLVTGVQRIQSDYIYTKKSNQRYKYLNNVYAGVSLSTILGYLAPLNIKVLVVSPNNDKRSSSTEIVSTFNVEINSF